jgi:hypothetical protein
MQLLKRKPLQLQGLLYFWGMEIMIRIVQHSDAHFQCLMKNQVGLFPFMGVGSTREEAESNFHKELDSFKSQIHKIDFSNVRVERDRVLLP